MIYSVNLSSDIISSIISFLNDNSSICFIQTCKSIKTHGDNHGFIKKMSADYTSDMNLFIKRFCKHVKTLRRVSMNNIENPHIWLPEFVETTAFIDCSLTTKLDPCYRQKPYKVKYLVLEKCKYNENLININKFKSLRKRRRNISTTFLD